MAKSENKKPMSKTTKIIIAVVCAIILIAVAGGGIYCAVTQQNPADATKSVFSSNEDKIIGKWQSQSSPGLSAYVFYNDGTYDSYLSTVNFSGRYTIDGSTLTLINTETEKQVQYKFSVTAKELTMTLLDDNGDETDDPVKYDLVSELNQKSFSDIIGDAVANSETTQATTE